MGGSNAQGNWKMGLPIQCPKNERCFPLLYPDREPGSEVVDFGCGRMTYDGHTGTDFAIPDERAVQRGVPVVTVAGGKVLRTRDGVPDRRIENQENREAVMAIACGNGIVMDHGNGWTTQYCHLRQGSVKVKAGQSLAKGEQIGFVGYSGAASFPHVHLTVRHQETVVDPFVGLGAKDGCRVPRNPLWEKPLAYAPTGLVRAGFAPKVPSLEELWQGQFGGDRLAVSSEALVFWVQAYGVEKGDVERIQLIRANGQVLADKQQTLAQSQRIWVRSLGLPFKSRPPVGASWRGRYELRRGNQIVVEVERTISAQ